MNAQVKAPRKVTVTPADPKCAEAGKDIRKRHLRVAPYCRVSTGSEEQLTSFTAQMDYYTQRIADTEGWSMVKMYADKGITGTSAKKRPEFLKMIRDAEKGKIDLVITKSVSRFTRNTLDGLEYVRRLKRCGVGVYFEKKDLLTARVPEYCGILAPFSGNWCLVGVQTYAEKQKEITRNGNHTENVPD